MEKDEEGEAPAASPSELLLPKELMIHVLCFLIPAPHVHEASVGGEKDETLSMPCPTLEDGVRWVFFGAGLVCRTWHLCLTGVDPLTGRPHCPDLWRLLACACGFWRSDAPLPPSIFQEREDWRQFFIRECQQNWTWSAARQVGKLGPELGEARFLLTHHGKKATLLINTIHADDNGYACGGIMTDQQITDKRNRIRIKVSRTTGFFTLGVCTGALPAQLSYRKNFAAFVEWDNQMISYDVTGQLINHHYKQASFPGFGDGDELEAYVEGDSLRYFRNGEEVGGTRLGSLPRPWHFYWAANCKGSSARILRSSERAQCPCSPACTRHATAKRFRP